MWWRMTKAIVLSWIVGVACGMVILTIMQSRNEAPPTAPTATSEHGQTAPESVGAVPSSAESNTR
jgi:uncharacterized membrane protein YedE/YeeE